MIVREFPEQYIMIAQHDHAAISGFMAKKWKHSLFDDESMRPSVEYAVKCHDDGWLLIDEAPFWNDLKAAPYTFTNYPTAPKTVLYRYGIQEVARTDIYAALLCSRHYSRFLENNTSDAAQEFVREEKNWREKQIEKMDAFDRNTFDFHYGVLQMLDDISLFLCLNKPGIQKENEHPFFKNGIKRNKGITVIPEEKIHIYWKNNHTVCLDPFIFEDSIMITLRQRVVSKKAIERDGLINSYQNAPIEKVAITLTPG